MEENKKVTIDLTGMSKDRKIDAQVASADKLYQKITAWIRSGGVDSEDNKNAALIAFVENDNRREKGEACCLLIGNGKAAIKLSEQIVKRVVTKCSQHEDVQIVSALKLFLEVLEPFEETEDKELRRLMGMIGIQAMRYVLKAEER